MRAIDLRLAVIIAFLLAAPWAAAAEWQPPKDETFTEKQLLNYFQVQKEAMANWKAAGKAVEGNSSSAAALAVYLRSDEKFKSILSSHRMSDGEYSYLSGKTWEAWSGLLMEQLGRQMQKGLADQKQNNQKKLAELKENLARYEKAQKDGRRVMTQQERAAAVQGARDEQQSALDEAKQHAQEAKEAHEEAAKAQNDAKAADAAAAHPPADVSDDDKPAFIQQKKDEANQLRDSAKEARAKESEARKAETESKAKAAAATKRIADPDLPVTDDEKAEVSKDNQAQITALKGQISDQQDAMKLLDESSQAAAKSIADQVKQSKIPAQNLDLLRKHRTEFEDLWGIKDSER